MDLLEREFPTQPTAGGPGLPDAPGDLGGLRHAAEEAWRAADAAIDRALSGDSSRFLQNNRQRDGQ